jgi:heterodisulfide reductase subunit A-like polyferredoxin
MDEINTERELIGAVLVCGGGITGIQSALDLANSGIKVYLLESSPWIGGNMARLDKTFPTGDCSVCILSPKLVECARDINIDILTNSEIVDINGDIGDFRIKVRTNPRYVSTEKCTACNDCIDVCPVSIADEFNQGLSERKAIYINSPQSVPNIYAITKRDRPSCQSGCPIGQNVQAYLALISRGEYRKALDIIREDNPLPSVLGYVCHHPCEDTCQRDRYDNPLSIRDLKRFATEKGADGEIPVPEIQEVRDERIAIVGAGPAGLSAADNLARKGYRVTVFDRLKEPGGMMTSVIPEFRLPKNALKRDIEVFKKMGVEFELGMELGVDFKLDGLKREYEAVILAIGTHTSVVPDIPGSELDGVYDGLGFLKSSISGDVVDVGDKVAVVGGGNTAIDSARTALRLGAESVSIFYRRTEDEMPAFPEEIESARNEGIEIFSNWSPIEIYGKGSVEGIKLVRSETGFEDGRRTVKINEDETLEVFLDSVIIATGIGIETEISKYNEGIEIENWKYKVDDSDLQTGLEGVFACGDMINGPTTIVEAVLSGRLVGESVDAWIKGEDFNSEWFVKNRIKGNEIVWDDEKRDELDEELNRIKDVEREERVEVVIDDEISEERALEESARCLNCGGCCECMECVNACEPDAIFHNMKDEELELEVGSIVLTSGFNLFDVSLKGEFGYGRYENVITNLQFERLLSSSGPTRGEIRRLSDENPPKSIAFIQCVGSRDASIDHNYCSAVCCMSTIKEAMLAREHLPDTKISIFYIDIRAFGKGFEEYYKRAEREYGLNFIKCSISRLYQNPRSKNLRIVYVGEPNHLKEEEFDMVVLAGGIEPSSEIAEFAKKYGVDLDEFGFFKTNPINPIHTSREGLLVAGVLEEPKDIPESVIQASASSSEVLKVLSSAKNTRTTRPEFPKEREIVDEIPRIGVFVCNCGINIGGIVDVGKVVEFARGQPGVVYAEENLYTCSDDTQLRIKELISEHHLNRVVIASCSPRTHLSLFRETLRQSGLNPNLIEMANIRDQCSWVHSNVPEKATDKSKTLVAMGITRARTLQPLSLIRKPVVNSALIIGGGPAGMTAGLDLAEQGYRVDIVEKMDTLGGKLTEIYSSIEGFSPVELKDRLIEDISQNDRIYVHLNSEVIKTDGHIGDFRTTIRENGKVREIGSGVIIIATGGDEVETNEYHLNEDERILTNHQLEKSLHHKKVELPENPLVVFIQCVDSRNDKRPYCSRICCGATIKNAMRVKEKYPHSRIFVLYRDIRTYGTLELKYEEARRKGIIFTGYKEEDKPVVVSTEEGLRIEFTEPALGRKMSLNPDMIVLATGVDPSTGNREISEIMKLPLTGDGFFQEAHIKLKPVEFATEGVYLCGTCHSPKYLSENITQAKASAGRASTVLSRDYIEVGGEISVVDTDKCVACLTCINICPYNAPHLNEFNRVEIEPAMCMGCGSCAVECPNDAITFRNYDEEQILEIIEDLAK